VTRGTASQPNANTAAEPNPMRGGGDAAAPQPDSVPAGVNLRDAGIDDELREILARVVEMRPLLRARQAETEANGRHSHEVHELFVEAGLYRILQPRKYGGLELGVTAFFRVISEVARGCPSTGWCLCLAAGHALQLASYFPEAAQAEVFGRSGYMVSPASGNSSDAAAIAEDGGFRITGKWRYCSGSPYSTHFMGLMKLPVGTGGEEVDAWFIVNRDQYEVLDDWGGIMGMKGSGSNSIQVTDAFVAGHLISEAAWTFSTDGPTPGSDLHDNPTYGGNFEGFAEGEIAAIAAGTAMAAVDEYEATLRKSFVPNSPDRVLRADDRNYQRWLGVGLALADAAAAISIRGGQLYEEYARLSVAGIEPFNRAKGLRLNDMYFAAEQLAYDAIQTLLRNGSSTSILDGQPMQRYYRDISTVVTRVDALERAAADAAAEYLSSSARG
jgi:3-hydroxy-9,10-secoandrosta-1,3,5(10)-triene-9,17-dione monooxygenase